MRPVVWSTVIVAGFLACSAWAFAQHSRGGMAGGSMRGGGMRGGMSRGHGIRGHAPRLGHRAASPRLRGRHAFRSRFRGSVTDPSFAGRLGRTVSGHPFPIPNINFPGGEPGLHGNFHRGNGHRFHRGFRRAPLIGLIIYTIPYYSYYARSVPAQPQQNLRSAPGARIVTLLAFKDATVIAVTDYWLEGNMLVSDTTAGTRTIVLLDLLDLALTQQLNFERNVPFILEARP